MELEIDEFNRTIPCRVRLFLIACISLALSINLASAASFEEAHTAIVRQARSEINEQHLQLIRAQNTINIDGQAQALARQAQIARKYIRGLEKLESIASGQSQKLLVLKFPPLLESIEDAALDAKRVMDQGDILSVIYFRQALEKYQRAIEGFMREADRTR